MPVTHVTTEAEFEQTLASNNIVVVDFFATWCGPCKMVAPFFAELSERAENAGIVFIKVDVEELEAIAAKYDVQSLPCFAAFVDGQPRGAPLIGAHKPKLEAYVAALNA